MKEKYKELYETLFNMYNDNKAYKKLPCNITAMCDNFGDLYL